MTQNKVINKLNLFSSIGISHFYDGKPSWGKASLFWTLSKRPCPPFLSTFMSFSIEIQLSVKTAENQSLSSARVFFP